MNVDDKILNLLLKGSKKAFKRGEVPVCAVITDSNNNIISYAYNNRQRSYNVLGHAEIKAIIKAEKRIKDWRLNGCKMYVTLEPCEMCSVVINESRIDEVFYFLENDKKSNLILKSQITGYEYIYNELLNLLNEFFDNMR